MFSGASGVIPYVPISDRRRVAPGLDATLPELKLTEWPGREAQGRRLDRLRHQLSGAGNVGREDNAEIPYLPPTVPSGSLRDRSRQATPVTHRDDAAQLRVQAVLVRRRPELQRLDGEDAELRGRSVFRCVGARGPECRPAPPAGCCGRACQGDAYEAVPGGTRPRAERGVAHSGAQSGAPVSH